jgi:hypothetical protein
MKKEKAQPAAGAVASTLDQIKILAVQAVSSDDDLLEELVLKGGKP